LRFVHNAQHKFDQQNRHHKNEKKVDLFRERLQIRIFLHQKNEGHIHQAIANENRKTEDHQNNSGHDLQAVDICSILNCEDKADVTDHQKCIDYKAGNQRLVKTLVVGLLECLDWVFQNLIGPEPLEQQCERDNAEQVGADVVERAVKSKFCLLMRIRDLGLVIVQMNCVSN
jgi:hypothetical protein